MFCLKSIRFLLATVRTDQGNFVRIRELRRIVKAFEPMSDADPSENIHPRMQQLSQDPARKAPSSTARNPFRSAIREASTTIDSVDALEFSRIPQQTDTSKWKLPRDSPSPFDPVDPNDPPDLVTNFPPTFNLAAYVNKSETLQQLIKLGVDLNAIEKRKGLPQFVLKLDFENDMKPHLVFLSDVGVPAESLGGFITKNPLIFKEDLGDLEVRVNYLEVKKFQRDEIARIVVKNPFWLMFSTQRIDQRMGHFQKNFRLSGNEMRYLATKQPRVITYNMEHIRKNTFCIREEMGFGKEEVKCLLLGKPKLWMMDSTELVERFKYVHLDMNMSHSQIVQCPEILTSRLFRLKQRHGFLKYLGKAQYDASKELYVSLKRLVAGTDKEFVIDVAKSSMEEYNTYLRTL